MGSGLRGRFPVACDLGRSQCRASARAHHAAYVHDEIVRFSYINISLLISLILSLTRFIVLARDFKARGDDYDLHQAP